MGDDGVLGKRPKGQPVAAPVPSLLLLSVIVFVSQATVRALAFLGPLTTLLLAGLVLAAAPRRSRTQRAGSGVSGWLTFLCGVAVEAVFVARAFDAAAPRQSDPDVLLLWTVVAGCWWSGGLVGLATWALEEWLFEPVGRTRLVGHLQAGLVSGAWGLLLGASWLTVSARLVRVPS